jgi:hypothetical protein
MGRMTVFKVLRVQLIKLSMQCVYGYEESADEICGYGNAMLGCGWIARRRKT